MRQNYETKFCVGFLLSFSIGIGVDVIVVVVFMFKFSVYHSLITHRQVSTRIPNPYHTVSACDIEALVNIFTGRTALLLFI